MTTTTPAAPRVGLATRPLLRYRTVDLLVVVAIGLAFGVAFRGYAALYLLIDPLTTVYKPAVGILAGLWFLPAMVAALVVRRPGAALLAEVVAASLEAILGGQWGISTVLSGLLQGGGIEIVLAVLAYRRFRLPVAMVAGMGSAVLEWCYERFWYYGEFSTLQAGILLVLFLISGALLCGALGWAITRALAKTGALGALPAGREGAESRRV